MPHPLETMMQSAMSELRQLVDVDTVVGKPVQLSEHTLVVPVSRVTLGFVSGGAEYGTKNPVMRSGLVLDGSNRAYPFAGTMTAGVSVTPVAFLSVQDGSVRVLPAAADDALGCIAQALPGLLEEAGRILEHVRKERRTQ